LTGARGGIGAGNAFFNSANPARTARSAAASFFSRSGATLSISRSAWKMKPRASWYSTGLAIRPPTIACWYSPAAALTVSTAAAVTKPAQSACFA
jgi:hypothetical protein